MLKGKAFKLGDDISTDHIIPGRYFHLRSDLPELAKHTLEDVAPNFLSEFQPGGFLVAGKNFGLGSSREHAPLVLKMSGVRAVLVESAARIFFRNAINQGLPVLICDTTKIGSSDELNIDLSSNLITDLTSGEKLSFGKIPPVLLNILDEGGLVPYMKKYGDFRLSEGPD
jgi:3-isopropylmalate/(R)-2-methylmalate dehydratase small subunit